MVECPFAQRPKHASRDANRIEHLSNFIKSGQVHVADISMGSLRANGPVSLPSSMWAHISGYLETARMRQNKIAYEEARKDPMQLPDMRSKEIMAKTKVLVIDDDSGIRESLKDVLVLENFDCTVASSGEQGTADAGNN